MIAEFGREASQSLLARERSEMSASIRHLEKRGGNGYK